MPTNLTRIALSEHKIGPVTENGQQSFAVPGEFYHDGMAREFTLPAAGLQVVAQPGMCLHSHAIYTPAEDAIRAGVMGIINPKKRNTWHQVLRKLHRG